MREERLDRLDRTVTRLMQAQQEALETCEQVLDHDDEILDDVDEFMEAPSPRPSAKGEQLYRAALEDVRAILVGASEDVQQILGEGNESGN